MAHSTRSPRLDNSVRLKVEKLINQIIEESSVAFFTGLPFLGPMENILYHHFSRMNDRQVQIISALSRTRNKREATVKYIYEQLSIETLSLLQSISSTLGYVDRLTRTQVVICILIGFMASPHTEFFRAYSQDYPARWNVYRARNLIMYPNSAEPLNHHEVTTGTLTGRFPSLDFSGIPAFSHIKESRSNRRLF